ncbi:MAG TPA: hypothetical protein VEY93_13555 [Longimicrobium sp.]|nr:hypothetical protein [Longimicrobium sp.]
MEWSFFDAFVWLSVVLVLVVIPFTEVRRRRLGTVLVRVPPVPAQRIFAALGAMHLALALYMYGTSPAGGLLTACAGLLCLTIAVRRFELRERGIAGVENAWPWREVEHYHWVGPERGTLHLRLYWRWWFRTSGVVPVPSEQREAVERILREHASHAAPTLDWAQNRV